MELSDSVEALAVAKIANSHSEEGRRELTRTAGKHVGFLSIASVFW